MKVRKFKASMIARRCVVIAIFSMSVAFFLSSCGLADDLVLPPTAADIARAAVASDDELKISDQEPVDPKEVPKTDVPKNPEAPALYEGLIKRGNVEFEFYDPKNNPRTFDGETHFRFFITYRYRYTYRIRKRDGVRTAFVNPTFSNVNIVCNNKIYIPQRFVGENFWKSKLVEHEFEHVRVNCDNRPRLIADLLLQRIARFEIALKDDEELRKDDVKKIIGERVVKIRTAIIDLIQSNNDYLDELTKHGIGNLQTPDSFYQTLYEPERIEKLEFAYYDDIEKLVESEKYVSGHE